MPSIQWTELPRALRDHLFDRLRDRQITVEDLYQLKLHIDGMWFFADAKETSQPRFVGGEIAGHCHPIGARALNQLQDDRRLSPA